MKCFAHYKPNRTIRWTGTLAVLAAVLFYPLGSRAEDLSLNLFTNQAALDYPLGTSIEIMLVIKNDTGFELNTDKGFAQTELQKGLTLTTPSGERQRYTDEDLAFDMPPPIFINDLVAVPAETLPLGWARTLTIEDLRELFPIMKETPGWYTIEADQPFVRYAWTIESGNVGLLGIDNDPNTHREVVKSNQIQIYVVPESGAQLQVRVLDGSNQPATPLGQVPVKVFTGPIATANYSQAWGQIEPVLSGTTDFEGVAIWGVGTYCRPEPDEQYTALALYGNEYRSVPFHAGSTEGWAAGCGNIIAKEILFGSGDEMVDVTDKIELVKSRLRYDRRMQTSYSDVSLKNISDASIMGPIIVVIDNISNPNVTISNADGLADDGKPYFLYELDNNPLMSNQVSEQKRWIFSNPTRARFTFSVSCYTQ